MKKSKKSQSGMEYLILVGFLTLSIISVLGVGMYYSVTAQERVSAGQINSFGVKIISSAESVYYAGEPAKATINPYLPGGVKSINTVLDGGKYRLIIVMDLPTGENTLSFTSEVPIEIQGTARINPGITTVVLEAEYNAGSPKTVITIT
jgi:hypothetical protein